MNKKNVVIVASFLVICIACIGLFAFYHYWGVRKNQKAQANNFELVSGRAVIAPPNVPAPAGWYSWGRDGSWNLTFGDQPFKKDNFNSVTLIAINARDTKSETYGQWLSHVSSYLDSMQSPTSTKLWNVVNENLILQSEIQTPAGNYALYDFIFNNGVEYSFDLTPNPFNKKLPVYPTEAQRQALWAVVESVAERL